MEEGQAPMADKSFLDHAAEYTYKELERIGGDPAKLEIPLQTVAILYCVQAIIDNGGFQYLFENDFPFSPSYSMFSDAYRRIGALGPAGRLDKAVAMFPFETPHLDQQKRLEFMAALAEDDEFFELGNQVCGDESVWSALEEYAKRHAALFRVV
jgi:hypothetical protein